MSASEKLKALEPRTITLDGQWEMRRALPEIIAVVEAAEHTIGAGRFQAPPGPLPGALTALDEKLP